MKKFLFQLVFFLLLFGGVAEVFFRTVIPARESPVIRQESASNLMQYDPDVQADGLFTSGRWAQQRSRWHINHQGWNSPTNFLADAEREQPAVVITGDSQIEGFYVDGSEHLINRLQAKAGHRFVGYSLAVSGYKLGEYILVARYLAKQGIQPKVFILSINRGDFWRAVTSLGGKPGLAPRLQETDGTFALLAGGTYPTHFFRRALRRSALVRYLIFNANLNPFAAGTADLAMSRRALYPEADAAQKPLYTRALRFTVGEIKRVLPKTAIVFLVDADRQAIMSGKTPKPIGTFPVIERFCATSDCLAIDLTGPFLTAWKATKLPLHFSHNAHWNTHAHEVAAQALYDRIKERGYLP